MISVAVVAIRPCSRCGAFGHGPQVSITFEVLFSRFKKTHVLHSTLNFQFEAHEFKSRCMREGDREYRCGTWSAGGQRCGDGHIPRRARLSRPVVARREAHGPERSDTGEEMAQDCGKMLDQR